MFVVQEGGGHGGDEELGAVCVWAGVLFVGKGGGGLVGYLQRLMEREERDLCRDDWGR